MQRTLKLKLLLEEGDEERLLSTMERFNEAFNHCAKFGFKNRTRSKKLVHDGTYYDVRERFGLPASLTTSARDVACEALRALKLKKLPKTNPHSAIRYNKRVMHLWMSEGRVSICTLKGRIKATFPFPEYYQRYLDWAIKCSTLVYKGGTFYIHATVEAETPEPVGGEVLGIDRGIVNVAVCSNSRFFNSKGVKNCRGKYTYLRQRLQSKGTRSAKRKLKRLSGRERRFVADVNHCITKEISKTPFGTFALENLKSIRVQKRRGRKFNAKLNSWAFFQFEQFLRYKAEALGKSIVLVNSRYSSQKCSGCGHTYKGNRRGNAYRCRNCGLQLHADLNASRNIAQAGMSDLGRSHVNRPIVASSVSEHSVSPQLQPHGFSRG